MSESIGLRMARAYPEQIEATRKWFNDLEKILDKPDYSFEEVGQFVAATFEQRRIDEYERILFGYETLIENACDQTLSYLEFKPEILAAMAAKS